MSDADLSAFLQIAVLPIVIAATGVGVATILVIALYALIPRIFEGGKETQ